MGEDPNNPTSAPVPEPTPTTEPAPAAPAEPVAPATPAAPAAAASITPAVEKKSNKGLIIGICSVLAVAIIGTVVAVILINNNKPKPEDELNDFLNSLSGLANDITNSTSTTDDDTTLDWSGLFGDDEEEDDEEEDTTPSTTTVEKCNDAFDCLNKIDKVLTAAEIDAMTGIKGEKSEYSDTRYTWEFPNGETLEASTSYLDLSIDYKKELHKDDSIDLSGYNDIKDQIKSGITYDEFVTAMKGAKGTLYKKSEYSKSYLWVDGQGGYLTASVTSSGKISSVFGMLY